MLPKKYFYPAFFYYDADGISIEFPDLPGCLPCANDPDKVFDVAREALGVHLYGMEQDHDVIPAPSHVKDLQPEDGGVVAMVDVFMPPVRERIGNRYVKKTLTIPADIDQLATNAGVNFSQFLANSLREYLGEASNQ